MELIVEKQKIVTFVTHYKGQIISKGLFGIPGFLKKKKKKSFLVLLGKKTNSFVRFLEESMLNPWLDNLFSKLIDL